MTPTPRSYPPPPTLTTTSPFNLFTAVPRKSFRLVLFHHGFIYFCIYVLLLSQLD